MSADVNLIVLEGCLGNIGELTYHDNGRAELTVSLATHGYRPSSKGGPSELRTDWHSVELENALAIRVADCARVGQRVACRGHLRYRPYFEGTAKRLFVYVEAFEFELKTNSTRPVAPVAKRVVNRSPRQPSRFSAVPLPAPCKVD